MVKTCIGVFAAKRPVKKTWGKPKKTKENMFFLVFVLFTSRWSVRKVLDCFYFPSVSENASLSSNRHHSAKIIRIGRKENLRNINNKVIWKIDKHSTATLHRC